MSNPKNPSAAAPPTEPPELAAERERLLVELEKQAKAATGNTQAMLRKLHEVLVHQKPGIPLDFQLYADAKAVFERFLKEPVLPLPTILPQIIEFMQRRAVALGWTGKMQLPKGAPPPPPALAASMAASAPPAPAPRAAPAAPRGATKDGFEGSAAAQGSVAIKPSDGEPLPASQGKAELHDARLKTPGGGNLKG
jgi:hypothetical protein